MTSCRSQAPSSHRCYPSTHAARFALPATLPPLRYLTAGPPPAGCRSFPLHWRTFYKFLNLTSYLTWQRAEASLLLLWLETPRQTAARAGADAVGQACAHTSERRVRL